MPASITFHYDVVCPYAYIASHHIEALAKRCNAQLYWKPTLLGGIYRLDKASQGAHGSATDAMSTVKKLHAARDLQRQASRYNVVMKIPASHPQKSLRAQRLLCSIQDDQPKLVQLSKLLYKSYWQLNEDVTDVNTLAKYAQQVGVDVSSADSETAKQRLTDNTQACFDAGSFGVPTMLCERADGERNFWFGGDQMHLVDYFFNGSSATEYRKLPDAPTASHKPRVTFVYDFSSPWTYLGYCQLERLHKVADVTMHPVLLGAMFRAVGMANTPMSLMSDNKRAYSTRSLHDQCTFHNVAFSFTSHFPIRTVTPLRVALQEPRVVDCTFKAAWRDDKNIADPEVYKQVLLEAGFTNAEQLVKEASTSAQLKQKLTDNTQWALDKGVFGCPTFLVEVNGKADTPELYFGSDRIGAVLDQIAGWQPPPLQTGVWPIKDVNSPQNNTSKL